MTEATDRTHELVRHKVRDITVQQSFPYAPDSPFGGSIDVVRVTYATEPEDPMHCTIGVRVQGAKAYVILPRSRLKEVAEALLKADDCAYKQYLQMLEEMNQ